MRKTVSVEIIGGTVAFLHERVGFLTEDGRVLWISPEQKEFKGKKFLLGETYWVYFASEGGRVVGVIELSQSTREELPPAGEIQIEVKKREPMY